MASVTSGSAIDHPQRRDESPYAFVRLFVEMKAGDSVAAGGRGAPSIVSAYTSSIRT